MVQRSGPAGNVWKAVQFAEKCERVTRLQNETSPEQILFRACGGSVRIKLFLGQQFMVTVGINHLVNVIIQRFRDDFIPCTA